MRCPATHWGAAPASVALVRDQVHVWRATLDRDTPTAERMFHTLSTDECDRAASFRFERDRRRFIVRRGVLRAILGRYTAIEPTRLRFRYSAHGKPALTGDCGAPSVRFNLSHSDGVALFAIGFSRDIGIDLERSRADLDFLEIAEQFFSAGEVSTLRALPKDSRQEAFFACWTRKEAYIKAKGQGLSIPLDRFEVSLTPRGPAALLRTEDPGDAGRWSLRELVADGGYSAALCVEGLGWVLKSWQWPDHEVAEPAIT